jgi:hypothetical protein
MLNIPMFTHIMFFNLQNMFLFLCTVKIQWLQSWYQYFCKRENERNWLEFELMHVRAGLTILTSFTSCIEWLLFACLPCCGWFQRYAPHWTDWSYEFCACMHTHMHVRTHIHLRPPPPYFFFLKMTRNKCLRVSKQHHHILVMKIKLWKVKHKFSVRYKHHSGFSRNLKPSKVQGPMEK